MASMSDMPDLPLNEMPMRSGHMLYPSIEAFGCYYNESEAIPGNAERQVFRKEASAFSGTLILASLEVT